MNDFLNFEDLKNVVDLESQAELSMVDADWSITKEENSENHNWLAKQKFEAFFIPTNEYKNTEIIYAFESFERTYKKSGIKKRLTDRLELNWESFDNFQSSTDILFLYLIPKSLDWVFFANRDFCYFAKRN